MVSRRRKGFILVAALASVVSVTASGAVGRHQQAGESNARQPGERALQWVTAPFKIDQLFPSMMGPAVRRSVPLLQVDPPELLWLRGFTMRVVGPDDDGQLPYDYACHTNLNWPRQGAPGFKRPSLRAFTLTQGQIDVRLPAGFGLPMMSNEQLDLITQALNLNEPDANRSVRHELRVRYVRNADLTEPIKPLVQTHAQVLVSLDGEAAVFNRAMADDHLKGEASCNAGLDAAGSHYRRKDGHEQPFSAHWVVEPGVHEYRTLVTDQIRIPYDTTVHFIGVHVHPYSKSLELRDLTTGRTVWRGDQESRSDGIGLDWIGYYSSEEGLPIQAGHEYVLISVYDNPTDEPTTAMAVMFLYYHDKSFAPFLLESRK